MLESLTHDTFEARRGEVFTVRLEDGQAIETRLAQVQGSTERTARIGRAPFSLIFRGPLRPILPQRIYTLENAAMGSIAIFLVPLGPESGEMQYQAVFS